MGGKISVRETYSPASPSIINELPDEVLEKILLNFPNQFLIKTALVVCKRWHSIIDNQPFWLKKCQIDGRLSENQIETLKHHDVFEFKRIYFSNMLNRNLIKNPCGEFGFKHWCSADDLPILGSDVFEFFNERVNHRGNQLGLLPSRRELHQIIDAYMNKFKLPNQSKWSIEDHIGADPVLDESEKMVKNFVTSFLPTAKLQIVDFTSSYEVIKKMVQNKIPLKLALSENYAPRSDCSSKYRLVVYLVDYDDQYQLVDKYEFSDELVADTKWECTKHEFLITKPFKYVIYMHGGCDNQYWAGFYGSKMTNSNLRLYF